MWGCTRTKTPKHLLRNYLPCKTLHGQTAKISLAKKIQKRRSELRVSQSRQSLGQSAAVEVRLWWPKIDPLAATNVFLSARGRPAVVAEDHIGQRLVQAVSPSARVVMVTQTQTT